MSLLGGRRPRWKNYVKQVQKTKSGREGQKSERKGNKQMRAEERCCNICDAANHNKNGTCNSMGD